VLLTSRRTPPLDLGQWRSQGVDPEDLFVIGVKAAIEHRPAYSPIARASYTVDLPGPSAENLGLLPFGRVTGRDTRLRSDCGQNRRSTKDVIAPMGEQVMSPS
jgi:microcystin degradation protein MlrC